MGVLTKLCALATLWRFVTAGAASRLVLDRLSGKEAEAGPAMREALWKALVIHAQREAHLAQQTGDSPIANLDANGL